ncbi:TetR/AcrR family transcriptional regulator [Fodinibius halophilus]|uniref:TetR/AcrR family transcriptional regulator n=1 Tax=Fodinibius halophilus TaxID=1736908 RepID=A0A6M1T373_9BACT|nr:TetR/AcrR family transcriptional regulator [Fodinibius halophilus]NGP88509.1 TetR/AcrR family transcriptional regulator [Fodinibius halophilus]
MKKDPTATRTKIMNAAKTLILDNGFGGTTVDAVIERAGVSKGAFFHHFSSKAELGHILVKRYAENDAQHLDETLDKAEELSDDPLQQLLIFVKLFEQEMRSLEDPFPGCLYASYIHQSELFDDRIKELIRESMLKWRIRVKAKLEEVVENHPPKQEVDLESLADMLLVIFEGAFVLSQSLKEAKTVAQQLAHYHTYLQLLFEEKG